MFCEGLQHHLWFCLEYLICVKMATFQFYLQLGKQRKVGWVMLFLVKNSLVKERSVRRCVVVMQQPVLLSPKFEDEVFAHFHAITIKYHSSMRNWLFALPGRILYEQSPWCQRKWWSCSWLCSSPVLPLSVCTEWSMPFKHLFTAHYMLLTLV
jgi:hypothetical protein